MNGLKGIYDAMKAKFDPPVDEERRKFLRQSGEAGIGATLALSGIGTLVSALAAKHAYAGDCGPFGKNVDTTTIIKDRLRGGTEVTNVYEEGTCNCPGLDDYMEKAEREYKKGHFNDANDMLNDYSYYCGRPTLQGYVIQHNAFYKANKERDGEEATRRVIINSLKSLLEGREQGNDGLTYYLERWETDNHPLSFSAEGWKYFQNAKDSFKKLNIIESYNFAIKSRKFDSYNLTNDRLIKALEQHL